MGLFDWFGRKKREEEQTRLRKEHEEQERRERMRLYAEERAIIRQHKLDNICPKCIWWERKHPDICDIPWWLDCHDDGRQSKCD